MGHFNTLLSQVLQLIPKHEFPKVVDEFEGDKRTRKLKVWSQFTTLLFGKITGLISLRTMISGITRKALLTLQDGLIPKQTVLFPI